MNTHDIEQQRAAFEVAKAEIWCYINADDDAFAIWSAAWQAAVALDRQQRGEPVAWFTEDHLTDRSATTYDSAVAERWRVKGWPVSPLFKAPQPTAPAVKESLTVAEPVKAVDKSPVPSNEDIAAIWNAVHGFYGGAPFRMNHADFARALLAKYGHPAQPAASAEPMVTDAMHAHFEGIYNGLDLAERTEIIEGILKLATPVAAQWSVPDGWPKWYCVDKNGNAYLCRSESEAYDYVRLRRDAFPDRAPFQAMPLTPAPPAADQAQQDANAGHGHVFPRPDGVKMRCGGPGICKECSRDAARAQQGDTHGR